MKLKQVYGPFLVCGVGPDQIRKQGPVPMQCERQDRSSVSHWSHVCLPIRRYMDPVHNIMSLVFIFFCLRDQDWMSQYRNGEHIGWIRKGSIKIQESGSRDNEKRFIGAGHGGCQKTGGIFYILPQII